MAYYRLYFMDRRGHIARFEEFDAPDDARAIALANVDGQQPKELWCSNRRGRGQRISWADDDESECASSPASGMAVGGKASRNVGRSSARFISASYCLASSAWIAATFARSACLANSRSALARWR